MATIVELVNPKDTFGGLKDGYRRAQPGVPTSVAGQAPARRGADNVPGTAIAAPRILSSAAQHYRKSNATIPYPRVTRAEDLSNIGRCAPGDVIFIHRDRITAAPAVKVNQWQSSQYTASVSHPHANIHRLVGLDFMNRLLSRPKVGATILVNSVNPADEFRKLSAITEWTVDGVVLSDDSPGFMLSSTGHDDRILNVAVQGQAPVNNGGRAC